jgi:hypothetical protein
MTCQGTLIILGEVPLCCQSLGCGFGLTLAILALIILLTLCPHTWMQVFLLLLFLHEETKAYKNGELAGMSQIRSHVKRRVNTLFLSSEGAQPA